jgi:hypothetical protein
MTWFTGTASEPRPVRRQERPFAEHQGHSGVSDLAGNGFVGTEEPSAALLAVFLSLQVFAIGL